MVLFPLVAASFAEDRVDGGDELDMVAGGVEDIRVFGKTRVDVS